MNTSKKNSNYFIGLAILLVVIFFINISLGSVSIPFEEIFNTLTGGISSKESWQTIILNFRLPKAITAIMVGSGLSICGLLMQTLFRNPLAGPFVLGISSGASLGVALLILGSGLFGGIFTSIILSNWTMAISASLGAFLVLSAVIIMANKVRNTMSILIIGLMFGSLTSAIISVLSYFSEAAQIQQYLFWSFGSLGNLSWQELGIFGIIYMLGILGTSSIIKPLNSFLLGENYAKSLGINIKKSRTIILLISSLLTGVITAFSGPIAFVGIAIPHIAKMIFTTSNHKILIPASALIGAIVLLICDAIAQLPNSEFTLPINAITSLFGAPVVIWLLVRNKKIYV
ncbi:FecCD family ABC transporter permease [Tenacibaculum piscium]|uniref:Iron ABC transporter n=1 Tax=Tenacibaculum piscium TaxID=1458515 RepID=A0A2H1YF93_9FLAO|nr:iron ABC transporter permease [Tenacibaculum piscium]MBE7628949.1 iron chelate uptake ABC transporter family permease subunit [Tenacibaculum piscium]MBE7671252.1 iron chelate uptake ABC transporter family permease subunit [Tenacibaculum piscium]MBE7685030.1 iron chelate uptake ABC transporter family permease subunit [Tenacibaculum piscium]MCG8183598.1 iron ABC transporter permease [Tenacibaculum piscium]MCG8204915.1 iron ABC transporter permease [Tenacibaculum piscium]